jgi:hypothetical protein
LQPVCNTQRALWTLREHLKCVPVRRLHCAEHALNEFIGYIFVKQITHGIDKDDTWLAPAQG